MRLRHLTILALAYLLAACTTTNPGPGAAADSMESRHVSHLVSLLGDYCIAHRSQQDSILAILASGEFQASLEYLGVYESVFEGVNYGITPDQEHCTVDVPLEDEQGEMLISLRSIDSAIRALGYNLHKKSKTIDEGSSGMSVTVAEHYYYPDVMKNNEILLNFPLDRPFDYYMSVSYNYE